MPAAADTPPPWRSLTLLTASHSLAQVDEVEETVTVAAGITQRALLDYLAGGVKSCFSPAHARLRCQLLPSRAELCLDTTGATALHRPRRPAEYKHWRQPSGWTLPAFSWFLDQTIGGAVATGTHGSSMRWASLSSQLRGLRMVLANGTLLDLTPRSNPHLFMAAGERRVGGAGRLQAVLGCTCSGPLLPPAAPERTPRRTDAMNTQA